MNTPEIGDRIYFLEVISMKDRHKPPFSSATISKVGRKYATFSEVNDRTEEYSTKGYRYNLADRTIEYYWGTNEWRLLARSIYTNPVDAASEAERQLLTNALIWKRKELAIRQMPLDLARLFAPYLDLTDRELDLIQELREIKNPPRSAILVPFANEPRSPENQITLGELIELLNAIEDKSLPVRFAGLEYNSDLEVRSWRGSYSELAISFEKTLVIRRVRSLLVELEDSVDKQFDGWKGGEFLMTVDTPLWVANLGNSSGFLPAVEECHTQMITGITVGEYLVEIDSAICRY